MKLPDLWHKLLKVIDHERGLILGIVIAVVLAMTTVGCKLTTTSLVDGDRQVTSSQFAIEVIEVQTDMDRRANRLANEIDEYNADVESVNARIQAALDEYEAKERQREQIVATLGGIATGAAQGTVNPAAAIASVLQLLTLGAAAGLGADNIRKNAVIKRKSVTPQTTS